MSFHWQLTYCSCYHFCVCAYFSRTHKLYEVSEKAFALQVVIFIELNTSATVFSDMLVATAN